MGAAQFNCGERRRVWVPERHRGGIVESLMRTHARWPFYHPNHPWLLLTGRFLVRPRPGTSPYCRDCRVPRAAPATLSFSQRNAEQSKEFCAKLATSMFTTLP